MKRTMLFLCCLLTVILAYADNSDVISFTQKGTARDFPLSEATIYTDDSDHKVMAIAANMLAEDVERITGCKLVLATAKDVKNLPSRQPLVVAGTIGKKADTRYW